MNFVIPFALNSIRTNPTGPLLKSLNIHNSVIESPFNIMYRQNIVANDRTDALPRSGAVAGGVCGALAAVPLLAAYFFRILLPPKLQTDIGSFCDFQPLQRDEFFNILHSFNTRTLLEPIRSQTESD
jgi:hypothetical protein